jgi:signal transduction histidine kinase
VRSIGARLTLWYALSATTTLSILFLLGYQLQAAQLIRGLDGISFATFEQLKARLGSDYARMDSVTLKRRLQETTEYSSALFYIVVENPKTGSRFASENLKGREIPDIKGRRSYDALVEGVGETRVNEYLLPPLDVTIATPTQPVRESLRAYVRACAALTVLMLAMSVAIGFGLSRMLLRPVRLIQATASRIGSDNLSERIPVPRVQDEISDMARLLNQMFDRLETSFDQIRRFTQEASHELKTPLSLVRLHAEKMLAEARPESPHTEALIVQIEEIARLNQIIDDLLFLSRAEVNAVNLAREPVDVRTFLDAFHPDAQALAEHHGLHLDYHPGAHAEAAIEGKWIRQVLLNVLSNAIKVSPAGSTIRLNGRTVDGVWRVEICDQGPGVPPEDLERIFERFVRLNTGILSEIAGSGLGLAISRGIIRLHGGRIYAVRRKQGLCVAFEIPLALE